MFVLPDKARELLGIEILKLFAKLIIKVTWQE
jgi:hypothetical protein